MELEQTPEELIKLIGHLLHRGTSMRNRQSMYFNSKSDTNRRYAIAEEIKFDDLCKLLRRKGFEIIDPDAGNSTQQAFFGK